jgi:hypothetical protein
MMWVRGVREIFPKLCYGVAIPSLVKKRFGNAHTHTYKVSFEAENTEPNIVNGVHGSEWEGGGRLLNTQPQHTFPRQRFFKTSLDTSGAPTPTLPNYPTKICCISTQTPAMGRQKWEDVEASAVLELS